MSSWAVPLVLVLVAGACATSDEGASSGVTEPVASAPPRTWAYQLQGYPGGSLDALARAAPPLVVIDLARDGGTGWFRPEEIESLRASGTTVLAYFEIGSIEEFRPEYEPLRDQAPDLVLNRWDEWPDEHFVRYWDPRWWELVVEPRIDRALATGYDGVYLDTPLAYEEIDLSLVPGWTRDDLAAAMVDLIVRIGEHGRTSRPGFLVVPQNSPELRHHAGYTAAVDGIGMEELFFRATDRPCTAEYCAENLENARALRDAGKFVLAVDYATRPAHVRAACERSRREGFAGHVTTPELDRIGTTCP